MSFFPLSSFTPLGTYIYLALFIINFVLCMLYCSNIFTWLFLQVYSLIIKHFFKILSWWQNVYGYSSTIQNNFTALKIYLVCSIYSPLLPWKTGNHWSFYYLCSFDFSWMSWSWKQQFFSKMPQNFTSKLVTTCACQLLSVSVKNIGQFKQHKILFSYLISTSHLLLSLAILTDIVFPKSVNF